MKGLNCLVVGVEYYQCYSDNYCVEVQFVLFVGDQMVNNQGCEIDYDVCYDVIGQYDKYCGDQVSYCVNKVIEIDFCYVVQYQQVNVYQCWCGCVGWYQIREWGEEQDQQEQDIDCYCGQIGFIIGCGICC